MEPKSQNFSLDFTSFPLLHSPPHISYILGQIGNFLHEISSASTALCTTDSPRVETNKYVHVPKCITSNDCTT